MHLLITLPWSIKDISPVVDVKSFRSDYPAAIGGFDLETDMANVEKKLQSGYNVIVDTGALTEADADAGALRAEVERRSLGDRVVFWP